MLAVLFLNSITMKRRALRKLRDVKPVDLVEAVDPDDLPLSASTSCCRTCLSTKELGPIFASRESEKKRSNEMFLVTGLKIKYEDGLSQKICSKCVKIIKASLQFRRASRKAEKALLNITTNKKPKKKHKPQRKESKIITKLEVEEEYDQYDDDGYDNCDDNKGFNDDDDDLKKEVDYDRDAFETKVDVKAIMDDEECEDQVKEENSKRSKKKRIIIPNASSYKCTTCNKEFRMKATFKAHMRFHTNYCVCETCGKRCRNNNQLQEHKRARHGLGRIHKCAYCEYSSATKEALTIHERRHTGERPYVCDHCGATFHRRSNLVQHIAIHLPEKNFQCKICHKKQKSKKLLQIHEYKAHRPCPYKYLCPICRDVFVRAWNVRLHLVRTHGVTKDRQGAIERVPIPLSEQTLELQMSKTPYAEL